MWLCDEKFKKNMLYLNFHKTFKHQAYHSGNLGGGAPF